ncbi:iron-containing alcohol dehydrogenase [Shewanella avicenniae]|uniref:Iron-containing alcohol dehydrogenase n=1 Tax=Shewanella avicenniae TaxID=2814294 RepID=A0ABX7QLG0_9GAMM|nr:iron-containing alcohol dehydrogenase [Shewanella avicenniae]QSX32104.1 iron-containing alcohol dehydrogenase [Shewanella avicenniae]
MFSFEFYNPTRLVFGKDSVNSLDDLLPSTARILVLYGGSSAERTGTLAEVRHALGDRVVFEFAGVEPNPTYETLSKAVELVRQEYIDYLLAVGGGSVIDGSKFVAAAAKFEGDSWNILEAWGSNVVEALPLGVVLTLPATGSEMNNAAVITKAESKTKALLATPHVFPQFAILDPTKTYTLPARQLANGVVDAFVHVIEQYLTYPVGASVQDRFAEGILQTLVEIGPKVVFEPADFDSRANLMMSATLALNGLIGSGVPHDWATHFIGHELTALYEIDHARTLAVILPSLLNARREQKKAKLLQYGERVWGITTGHDEQRIDLAISKTKAFFESLGVKTSLSAYGLGTSAIEDVVANLEKHRMTALGEQQEITPVVARKILMASL